MRARLRFEVLERDDFSCKYCGRRAPEVVLHVDHITPRVSGGLDELENLAASCRDCNLGKGARGLRQSDHGYGDEEPSEGGYFLFWLNWSLAFDARPDETAKVDWSLYPAAHALRKIFKLLSVADICGAVDATLAGSSVLTPQQRIEFFYAACVRRMQELGRPWELTESDLEEAQRVFDSWTRARRDSAPSLSMCAVEDELEFHQ